MWALADCLPLAIRMVRPQGLAAVLVAACLHTTIVHASDWDDCFDADDVKTIIEGCSGIVASDHLQNWQRSMALNNRGSALLQSGDLPAAEDNYTRALALDPHYTKAYYNRGTVRQRSGNLLGAVDDFTQALILDDDYIEAYHNRGVAYEKIGRYDKAISDFTAALARKPDLHFALNNRGVAYRKSGSPRRAVEDFDAAIAINPGYANAYNNRAKAYFDLEDDNHAVSDASQAIELNPDFADAFHTRGGHLNGQVNTAKQLKTIGARLLSTRLMSQPKATCGAQYAPTIDESLHGRASFHLRNGRRRKDDAGPRVGANAPGSGDLRG